MSSGTSTKRRQAAGRGTAAAVLDGEPVVTDDAAATGIRPSHLFIVAGLFAASLVVVVARGQHVAALLLLSATVFAAALPALIPLLTARHSST